jgi:hypothetical protein
MCQLVSHVCGGGRVMMESSSAGWRSLTGGPLIGYREQPCYDTLPWLISLSLGVRRRDRISSSGEI